MVSIKNYQKKKTTTFKVRLKYLFPCFICDFVCKLFIKYCQSSDTRLGVQAKFKLAETRRDNEQSFEIVSAE